MAYGIVKRLKEKKLTHLPHQLSEGVQENEKAKGKKHQVFRLSFDAKECVDEEMLEQKLAYIHNNPVSGKWNLVNDFTNYQFSSAPFYELGVESDLLMHYKEVLHEIEL